jgi:hypothetical protein
LVVLIEPLREFWYGANSVIFDGRSSSEHITQLRTPSPSCLSALDVLSAFETSVLDGLPTGPAAADLLDRLKAVENLIAEIRAHYKEALSRDCSAVPRPAALEFADLISPPCH